MAAGDTGNARKLTRFLPDGTYAFDDELRLQGLVTETFVTCLGWLLEYFEVKAGALSFQYGEKTVAAPSRKFWVFYPPFSLCRLSLLDLHGKVNGKAGLYPVTKRFLHGPIMFQCDASMSTATVPEILAHAANVQPVDLNPRASALSARARKLIAKHHAADLSMARIASGLGVTNAHLSRQFRRDYGITPTHYLHQLRMADVPLRLAQGEAISDVSLDAGYGDLGRFYKQFRKRTQSSPGRCREMVRPWA
jgi:AraC-like DNA-binding protein